VFERTFVLSKSYGLIHLSIN